MCKPHSESSLKVVSPTRYIGGGEGGGIRIRTFFNEAIFIASAFFGAMYRFPFFIAEEDEAGRVAFCFEVFMPFILP